MKYININEKFTAEVSKYIAHGYTINTSTMSGSQGEIAHVDLTNGKQIIRVLLDDFNEWKDNSPLEGLKLVVGIAMDNVKPNDTRHYDTIWNNRLNVIFCEKFYCLSGTADDSPFYGTREEAVKAEEVRFERYRRRDCRIKRVLPQKASPLVKSFVRRKFGIKRVIADNISISKSGSVYTVTYNNHSAQLH